MMKSLPVFVGLRYASAKRGGMLVAFLSRISVAGLVLGVAMLVTVLSVMNGFEKELQTRILNLVPHTMVVSGEPIREWQTLREVIAQHPDIVNTAPFISLDALLSAGREVEAVKVHSVDAELERSLTSIDSYVVQGEFLTLASNDKAIALSTEIASRLNIGLGEKVRLIVPSTNGVSNGARPAVASFTLAAIFHTGTTIDQELVIIPLAAGQKLLRVGDAVQGVRAQTRDVFKSREISWDIIQQLPPGYYARDWRQLHGNLFQAIQMSRRLVTLMIFMVIAVALFNVVSSLVMVVTDKREDIAILKTMGAGTSEILKIFLIHGVIIAVVGTGLGVLLGCILSISLPDLVSALESALGFQFLKTSVYPVDYIPSDLRMNDVAVIAGSAVAMSVLATVYPAYRASKIQPANALRWH